jgi:DnaJ-class molecular chaperone
MKCSKCSGAGYIYNNLVGYAEDCSVCHGKGEVQNNEEWFCALPTKDKAKFLEAQQKHGGTIASRSDVDWEVWLKEEHKDA